MACSLRWCRDGGRWVKCLLLDPWSLTPLVEKHRNHDNCCTMAQDGRIQHFSFVHVWGGVHPLSRTLIWSWTLFVDTQTCERNFLTSLLWLPPKCASSTRSTCRTISLFLSHFLNSCLFHSVSPTYTHYLSFPPRYSSWYEPLLIPLSQFL